MRPHDNDKEWTMDHIERNLMRCAELVDRFGPAMQPWLDRMEAEYESAKTTAESATATDRVRRMLGK